MSAYPPPLEDYTQYNSANFDYTGESLSLTEADARYLKLTGGILSGLTTFNAGLSSASNISVSSGNVALTGGTGSFHTRNGSIANPSFAFQNDQTTGLYRIGAGNIGFACSGTRYMDLNSSRLSILGNLNLENSGFSSSFVPPALTADRTYTLRDSSGTIAFLSDVSSPFQSENIQNKTFILSSNTSIASVASNTITTTAAHNLLTGDTIRFPVVGGLTGITQNTIYTVQTTPTTTTFTINSTIGGTVTTAYYLLETRAPANTSTAGGSFAIKDATNQNNGIYFDVSTALAPLVIQSTAAANPARFTIPSFGGQAAVLANTQTFTGRKTFSGGVVLTQTGSSSAANSSFYSNPANTALTGTSSYFWNYFGTPPTSGTSTGTSANVVIQGAPTGSTNNYALQVLAGQNSFASGTVAAPSLVFGNSNSSGFYSSSANVINTAISGVNVHQVNSTGLTVSGITQSSTSIVSPLHRPITGNLIQSLPFADSAAGTAQLRISPTSGTWAANGVAELQLGDNLHYIRAVNTFGMFLFDTNAISFSTTNYFNFADNGTTSYFGIGAIQTDPIGANTYGFNFGSGAASGSVNLYANSTSGNLKIGRNTDGDCMRFYRNNPSTNLVGSITVTATGTAYNTTSDRRLKEDITELKANSLSLFDQVKVYEYTYKGDSAKQKCTGILADEIQTIFPEIVSGGINEIDEYGNVKPQMVDYSKIVPFLLSAVKELNEKIKNLEKK